MSNIEKFILLVSKEEFEEAHEVLEHDWLEFKRQGFTQKALFYKGLINGATSIALIRLNRSQRAKEITWNAFLKYQDYLEHMNNGNCDKYREAISLIKLKREKYLS